MKRLHIRRLFLALFLLAGLSLQAQEVTYIHERDIMNQFTTMETGKGSLSPAWYYNAFHKNYQKDANVRNKLLYRTEVMANTMKEVNEAEKIDSSYVKRAKVEALNITSRSSISDMSWTLEKSKLDRKMELFNKTSIISSPTEVAPVIIRAGAIFIIALKWPSRSPMNPIRTWV